MNEVNGERRGMNNHKDLEVWKRAVELAREVYETTKSFPKEEVFGLTSQMKRASVSIASNIAEGAARKGQQEFVQFLYIAIGSASELDTQIEIAKAIGMGNAEALSELQLRSGQDKSHVVWLGKISKKPPRQQRKMTSLPLPIPPFTVHSSLFTVHGLPLTVHGLLFTP